MFQLNGLIIAAWPGERYLYNSCHETAIPLEAVKEGGHATYCLLALNLCLRDRRGR